MKLDIHPAYTRLARKMRVEELVKAHQSLIASEEHRMIAVPFIPSVEEFTTVVALTLAELFPVSKAAELCRDPDSLFYEEYNDVIDYISQRASKFCFTEIQRGLKNTFGKKPQKKRRR